MDAAGFPAHVPSIGYGILVSLVCAAALHAAGLAVLPRRSDDVHSELPALIGMALFLSLCWFGVAAGVSLPNLAAGFAGAAFIVGLCRFRWIAASVRGLPARSAAGWALVFSLLYVLGYLFTMPPVTADQLPIAWTGNVDLVTYIRHAQYLLDPQAWNRWMYVNHVYALTPGVFHLLGTLSLFYDQDPIQAAMPAQFAFTALTGLLAVRISRKVFLLSRGAAFAVGAILVSGSFFRYLAAAYFISTFMALPVLLFLVWSTVSCASRRLLDVGLWLRFGTAYVLLLLIYPYLLVVGVGTQLAAIALTFVADLHGDPGTSGPLRPAAGRAGGTLGAMLVMLALLVGGFHEQVRWLGAQAASLSEPSVAGWPMDLIRPAAIIGLPGGEITEAGVQIVPGQRLRTLASFGVMAAWLFTVFFLGAGASMPSAARALAGVAGASIIVYAAYFYEIGPSYQQWKFASYSALPWSFVLFAGSLQLLERRERVRRLTKAAPGRLAAGVLLGVTAVGLVGGNLWYRTVNDRDLRRFPGTLRDIAQIDALTSFRAVSLWSDNPRDLGTALALYFLPSKRVHVVGDNSTFNLQLAEQISPVHPLLVLGDCPDADGELAVRVAEVGCLLKAPPTPALGTQYSFASRVAFMTAEGLDRREPTGRWNRTDQVRLRLTADARRMSVAGELYVNLHLQPFLPPGVRSEQRMDLEWGANRRAKTTLDDKQGWTEWISLPVRSEDWSGNWVWMLPISIGLPDASDGVWLGPEENRQREERPLAVFFIDFSVSTEPRGRVILPADETHR
jgi:hypothetical protein